MRKSTTKAIARKNGIKSRPAPGSRKSGGTSTFSTKDPNVGVDKYGKRAMINKSRVVKKVQRKLGIKRITTGNGIY